ncbi:MAG: hypothetical protein LBP96_05205 [Bacteroidales bacterium]|jgi:mannose-6-phosphate isomerase-like protein (cupin superfamily)|nr:hypothetical protein [Bacteroidales bacterium]
MQKRETWQKIHTLFGYVQISNLHGKNEMSENIKIACFLANKLGHSIFLLARSELEKTPDSKNATLGIFQEYKVNKTPTQSAINKQLRIAAKQADYIILWIDSKISLNILERGVKGRVKLTKNVKEVWIILNGEIKMFSRSQILENEFSISK